jgi:hypothetical protein
MGTLSCQTSPAVRLANLSRNFPECMSHGTQGCNTSSSESHGSFQAATEKRMRLKGCMLHVLVLLPTDPHVRVGLHHWTERAHVCGSNMHIILR